MNNLCHIKRCIPSGAKAIALSIMASSLFAAGSALGQEAITLKTVAPYNVNSPLSKPLFMFKEMVEQKTAGKVKINVLGAEEVMPSAQQFDGLRNGVVDVIYGITSYYAGAVPEGLALLYTRQLPAEQRKTGLYEVMRKVHLEKANVIYLANAGGQTGQAFRIYLRKSVDKADLTGFRIRVSPVYIGLVKALNGTPVSIPFSDTYTALERGVADGFGWTYGGLTEYGLQEVSKFVLDHPFYSLNSGILFNRRAWEALPEPVRKQLEELGPAYELAVQKFTESYMASEDTLLKSKGMHFIKLPEAEAKKFLAAAYEAGWQDFLKRNPESGPAIKAAAEK